MSARTTAAGVGLLAVLLAGCEAGRPPPPPAVVAGHPDEGRRLIEEYGCGHCHVIPGVADADGRDAPPLEEWARRPFIAGAVRNNEENLIRWVMVPAEVKPGTVMPALGVSEEEARHIAAYLMGLR